SYLSHVKGVAQLTNDLQVLPTSPLDDSLRLAIARAIYNDSYFVNYANQAVPPIHIIVDNQNVTLEGVVNSQIDKQRAEMDARFAGTYLSLTNNLQVETGRKKPA
ncbi:MAG: BON domain-containing protein, partial [Terriglobia bacterium]